MAKSNGSGPGTRPLGLRERIDAAEDLPRETVAVPEWGVDVWLRALSDTDSRRFLADALRGGDGGQRRNDFQTLLVSRCLVDEAGDRVYGDEPEELAALGAKNPDIIVRLYHVAARLCGLETRIPPAAEDKDPGSDQPAPDPDPGGQAADPLAGPPGGSSGSA